MTDVSGLPVEPHAATAEGEADPKALLRGAAETVKAETSAFVEAAGQSVQSKVEEHKAKATDALGDFAGAIRRAGEELSQNDRSAAGQLVKQAADGLEGLSRTVSDKRPDELLQAVRQFGRDNPTAFIAGSVLAGIALGRFVRASEKARTEQDGPASTGPAAAVRPELGTYASAGVDEASSDLDRRDAGPQGED